MTSLQTQGNSLWTGYTGTEMLNALVIMLRLLKPRPSLTLTCHRYPGERAATWASILGRPQIQTCSPAVVYRDASAVYTVATADTPTRRASIAASGVRGPAHRAPRDAHLRPTQRMPTCGTERGTRATVESSRKECVLVWVSPLNKALDTSFPGVNTERMSPLIYRQRVLKHFWL